MASTSFNDFQPPPIRADWLNDVNTAVYNTLPALSSTVTTNNNYNDPLAPSIPKTMSDLVNGEEVSIFRFIPVNLQAGIYAGTNTDDLTSYFQAAFNSVASNGRGSLFIPAGLYNINQVTIPAGLKIRGAGQGFTILKATGTLTNNVLLYADNAHRMMLSDLQVQVDRAIYTNANALLLWYTQSAVIRDVFFSKGGKFAIQHQYGVDNVFERVTAFDVGTIGLYNVHDTRTVMRDCLVRGVYASHGIQFSDSDAPSIIGCCTEQTAHFGLSLIRTQRGVAVNHRSRDTKVEGINLENCSYCQLVAPTVSWSGDPTWASTDFGISIFGTDLAPVCDYNKVSGAVIIGAAKSGLALAENARYNTIHDLTVVNPNGLDEVQGSAVLLYGSGIQYNTVSALKAWADNGKMRYGVYEFDDGGNGPPSNNYVRSIDVIGDTITDVQVNASTSYVVVPTSGTLATTANLSAGLAGKENTITAGTTSQYWRGDKSWVDFATTTKATTLSGITATNSAITGADSVLGGFGKAQGQINNLTSTKADLAGATFTGALTTSSNSGGVGYATGSGGSVTQTTSKSTSVTLNRPNGRIITNNAALGAGGVVSFTVSNSTVAATDTVICHRGSGGTDGAYWIYVDKVGAGTFGVVINNLTGGSLSEAITINFSIIKTVVA